ncbi:MAG: GTPase, partial [Verrucomicrobiia bacterium]
MPAERFLASLGQFEKAAQNLRALAELLPDHEEFLARIDRLVEEAKRPITLAISGPPASGKSILLEKLFGAEIGGAKPRRSGAITRVIKHQALKPEERLPPGVEEFFLSLPTLQHFQIVDFPGLEESTGSLADLHQNILPLVDLVLFCFRANEPWHPPTWSLLQSLKRGILRRALFVLTSQTGGAASHNDAELRYFRQTGTKKFGFEPEVIAVDLSNQGTDVMAPLLAVLDRKLSGSHPHVLALQDAINRLAEVAGEMESTLRKELDSIRADEYRVLDFERRILTQHSWLRLELEQGAAQLMTITTPAVERAAELFAKETSLSRLHNIFALRNRTSHDLQEGVCDALRKLVLPKLEAITLALEQQLHERWEPLSEVLDSRVLPLLKDAL